MYSNSNLTTRMNKSSFSLFKRKSQKEEPKEEGKKIKSIKDIKVDDKIMLTKNNLTEYGTIRYIGDVIGDKKKLKWVGVEWATEGYGDCDGETNGKRYFQTSPKTATFYDFKTFQSTCLLFIE